MRWEEIQWVKREFYKSKGNFSSKCVKIRVKYDQNYTLGLNMIKIIEKKQRDSFREHKLQNLKMTNEKNQKRIKRVAHLKK